MSDARTPGTGCPAAAGLGPAGPLHGFAKEQRELGRSLGWTHRHGHATCGAAPPCGSTAGGRCRYSGFAPLPNPIPNQTVPAERRVWLAESADTCSRSLAQGCGAGPSVHRVPVTPAQSPSLRYNSWPLSRHVEGGLSRCSLGETARPV